MSTTVISRLLVAAAFSFVAVNGLAGCSSGVDDPGPLGGSGVGPNGETILDLDPSLLANEGTEPEVGEYMHLVTPDLAVCPLGSAFDEVGGFCVAGGQALGPFAPGLVAECEKLGGGAQCATAKWDLALAQRARGDGLCPAGTNVDLETGLCTDDRYAYGPFDLTIIKECRLNGGGAQCDELRFDKWFAPLLTFEDVSSTTGGATFLAVPSKLNEACGSNAKLFNFYKSQDGFMRVRRAARAKLSDIGASSSKHPDRNGCATYLSYALKQSGAVGDMPIQPGTEEFRDTLLKRGWKVIKDPNQFQPGDVIISRDRKGVPGHPDHVYMYAGSKDGSPGNGYVIDNQGTMIHERNVSASGSKTRAAYALRAPNAKTGSDCGEKVTNDSAFESEDSCGVKADGWYCSDLREYSAYKCVDKQIQIGFQCAQNQTCTRVSAQPEDKAQMSGEHPACGSTASAPSGQTCKSDGQCNPGSNGAGKLCTGGQCVPGCRADYQCPGSSTCQAGQCSGGSSGGGGGGGGGTPPAPPGGGATTVGNGSGNMSGPTFSCKGTGYFPSNSGVEGGFKDRLGAKLNTLQDFLAGKASYVSVAMDSKAFGYGTKLRIEELERKYGKVIEFRVVDTGGAFKGKGTTRMDVCVSGKDASFDPTINGTLSVRVSP